MITIKYALGGNDPEREAVVRDTLCRLAAEHYTEYVACSDDSEAKEDLITSDNRYAAEALLRKLADNKMTDLIVQADHEGDFQYLSDWNWGYRILDSAGMTRDERDL